MRKRKQFTSEFKREAVRLMERSGNLSSDVARELGVRRNQLYKWKEQLDKRGTKAFPGGGRQRWGTALGSGVSLDLFGQTGIEPHLWRGNRE